MSKLRFINDKSLFLFQVACTGSESGFQYCDHQGWGSNDCSHGEDVAVECGNF